MKQHEVREHLQHLSRKELEELSERVLGESNSSLKNKSALISVLSQRPKRIAKALGVQASWWERHSSHLYGWVGLISFGITLFAFFSPESSSTISAPVDPLRQQEVLDQVARIRSTTPAIVAEPEAERVNVEIVPEATGTGFELIQHSIVCDLRSFRPVSSVDQEKQISPVIQHVRQRIKKTGQEESKYRLWAHTSGLDVYSRSLTHQDRLTVFASEERRTVAKYLVRPRVLEFDVSDDPDNREFTLQVTKTFWNAFQNPDQSWVGVVVGLPTRSISYLIIFPDDKPYTTFDLFANDANKNRIDLPAETYVLEDPGRRWLWWNIVNPKPGNGYNIDWEW